MLTSAQAEISRLTGEVQSLRAHQAAFTPPEGVGQIVAQVVELKAQLAELQAKQQDAAQQHAHEVYTPQQQFQQQFHDVKAEHEKHGLELQNLAMTEIARLRAESDQAVNELSVTETALDLAQQENQQLSIDNKQFEAEVNEMTAKLGNASMLENAAMLAARSAASADTAAVLAAPLPLTGVTSVLNPALFLQRIHEIENGIDYGLYGAISEKYDAEEQVRQNVTPNAGAGQVCAGIAPGMTTAPVQGASTSTVITLSKKEPDNIVMPGLPKPGQMKKYRAAIGRALCQASVYTDNAEIGFIHAVHKAGVKMEDLATCAERFVGLDKKMCKGLVETAKKDAMLCARIEQLDRECQG